MVLTGRTGSVALLGLLPLAVSPWPATAFVVLLVALAVAVVIDVALAGNPRAVVLTRTGDASARLGESIGTALLVHNAGSCRLRGRL